MAYKASAIPPSINSAQFRSGYHGSSHDLVGTHINPEVGSGRKAWDMSSDTHVNYEAANTQPSHPNADPQGEAESKAWGWAVSGAANDYIGTPRRPRVYQGEAEGRIGGDTNMDVYPKTWETHGAPNSAAMAAKRFKVTGTIWTPPPSKADVRSGGGVQGTIPHVNWNQFGAPNSISTDAANYPGTMSWTSGDYRAQAASDEMREGNANIQKYGTEFNERQPYIREAAKHQQTKLFE